MTNENGRPPEPDEPPGVHKTVNQIVAWNIAYYRKAAGLKQEELGKMVGRSKRLISSDERSWDGSHTREFNADETVRFACALGVPLGALYLPPDDDGSVARYSFTAGDGEELDMRDLTAMVMPDSDSDGPAMDAYRGRVSMAVGQYLDASWVKEAARWQRDLRGSREVRSERAAWLRLQRSGLIATAQWIGDFASEIEGPE